MQETSRGAITKTKLYHIWDSMYQRCLNPNSSGYHKYGAKGIGVCADWLDAYNFMGWALLNGYRDGLTIERVDFTKDYSPQNCTWIPAEYQAQNRGKSSLNTSGFVGVNWHNEKKCWIARVTVKGKRTEIGKYDSAIEAHLARGKYFKDNNLLDNLRTYELQHKDITI
jgi:hypothetical protein